MVDGTLEDRFVGCLLGLMVGDALGSHFEGLPADWIARRYANHEALLESPPEPPWHYTDDTEMMIGVAESLLHDSKIEESTLCGAFATNYTPSRGYGRGAHVIIDAIREGKDHRYWARELFPGGSFGNGAAMRVAPIGLLFHKDMDLLWQQARLSALPTHVHPLGIEGAQLLALAIAFCVREPEFQGGKFWGLLEERAERTEFRHKLKIARELEKGADVTRLGSGIAAHESVVTALAVFSLSPESYSEVIARAVLLGGDTDTLAAMAGAVAGAFLGANAISGDFLNRVEDGVKGRSYVADLARQLCRLIEK